MDAVNLKTDDSIIELAFKMYISTYFFAFLWTLWLFSRLRLYLLTLKLYLPWFLHLLQSILYSLILFASLCYLKLLFLEGEGKQGTNNT